MEDRPAFTEQDVISCSIIYRTNGLGEALKFLLNAVSRILPVERINILCSARDFSVFLPVADTMEPNYGIVRRMPGEKAPLLMPDKIEEPCIINDLREYRTLLDKLIPNRDVPLFQYSSMLRLPLFATEDYLFSMHFFCSNANGFSQDVIEPLQSLLERLKEDLQDKFGVSGIVPARVEPGGRISMLKQCPDMGAIVSSIANVAPTPATVLITGETGVGKEMVAEAIHELSQRANAPLVKVNCGAIPETLIESELFGHERGAFTGAHATRQGYFEMASGGTLFLDEIGEMSAASQVRLLRTLDSGVFYRVGNPRPHRSDVRIIAATNRNLPQLVREGGFRKDLYYRLAVYPLHIPPLRDRPKDILHLVEYFLKSKMEKNGVYILPKFLQQEQKRLIGHNWPGNVRELEYVVERALIDARYGQSQGLLHFNFLEDLDGPEEAAALSDGWPSLAELNNRYINMVLKKTGGRLSGPNGAANILGIHYTTLCAHLKKSKK